ncbi:GHKL domain-containing protein [Paraburkholderia panacisoli]|jgi:signal transduction histidine kinase|uniref:histidine kinase n=1 Tax=Paraburkholderia panacisoli TaxID=2603818 RepID=A0A5B0HGT5_9BURK|nr:MASE4 domain-containing protein [Paraburkholderia panacisoli]KAA1014401.1 GHKL domain-containing protein [Paraburkholderia panacisoli]
MAKTAAVVPEEQHFILSNLTPGPAQTRLALAVVLALLVAFFAIAGRFSGLHLQRIDAFVPMYATAMFVNDSITAVLLFAQFSILRSRALLVIASGYLFTGLVLIPWTLTFPGIFAPDGLLDAGPQSTAWLYILWHAGFPMFVIAYALLKDADPAKRLWRGSTGAAILSSVAMTAAIVCAATLIVTMGNALLPRLLVDTVHLSTLWFYAAGAAALMSVVALIVLWVWRRSVLDLWLMVVMCAYVLEICLISFPVPARYTVGWYAGRVCGFLSGSLVLFVLLYEITTLYAQLLRAVFAQRREREARLVTGEAVAATIAHEVRQPLSAMVTNADAGLRWLNRATPDLDETKTALGQIVANGHRAAAVIQRVRTMFRTGDLNRTAFDVNGLVGETVALVRADLQKHRIVVQIELAERLPQVLGDPIQLQQVLLNLIANAIESMAAMDEPRVLCVKSDVHDDGGVTVSVTDTGTGVGPHDIDRIFDPLFTTKSEGMGMGLAICRSIIEAHNGRLWVSPNKPHGAVFQFVLRTDGATSADTPRREQPKDLPSNSRL